MPIVERRFRTPQSTARIGGVTLVGGLLLLASAAPALAQETLSQRTGVQTQVFEPAFFTRFAPKSAADMVDRIPGFKISQASEDRGFGQARQNVLINGRRVSGKSNDAETALQRISAEAVVRIELVDGASLNIPGLSGQVANVIAKVDAFSGNWEFEPQFRENLQPSWYRGTISANGGTSDGWSWTAALEFDEEHNGHDGPGVITNGAGQVIDVRREGFNGAGEEPELDATLTYQAIDGSVANFNLALRDFNFVGRTDSFRNPVGGSPEARFSYVGEDERGGEIGADYEFDIGPGRLKLIGLSSYEDGIDLITVESYNAAGAPLGGDRVLEHISFGESILRGEYGFSAFEGDLQLAAEGAFNFLDVVTELGQRQPDGSYPMAVLPEGTARVEEVRAETNLSYSRPLGEAFSLQSSIGVEYSELSQTGANGLTREFVRPKGFVSLAWRADENLDISVKGERRVGQLDFGDFLSSIDLQNENQSAGNVDLVPEQSWIASAEIAQKLGAWGAVKLSADYRLIEDVIDQIPFGVDGSGVGNIDEATAWSIAGSGTINFDPIGATGLQFNFNWRYGDSEIDDPLTGVTREISFSDKLSGSMSLRWDIPHTPWAVLVGMEEYQDYPGYRLDQVSRSWAAPSINFFLVENKDVWGLRMRLEAVNLNDTSENFKREVYQGGRRTNPLAFTEERHRTFGPIIRYSVSGSF